MGVRAAVKFASIGTFGKALSAFRKDWGRRYVVSELGRMPGLPTKVAQFISARFERPEWLELAERSLPLEWVKNAIETQSPKLFSEISEISASPVVASIGQVHWARLKSGLEVAIKVQFPEVREQVDEQLELILSVLRHVPIPKKFSIDESAYRDFLSDLFRGETSYFSEARDQTVFMEKMRVYGDIVVPTVFKEYSTDTLLVQSFEKSILGEQYMFDAGATRVAAAESISRLWVAGILKHGMIQSDFHGRNWGYRTETNELVLYDFGALLRFDEEMRASLRRFFSAQLESVSDHLMVFEELGFQRERLVPIQNCLPDIRELLIEPLLSKRPWSAQSWKVQERMQCLLGDGRWWFRSAGPPWFLFLMRGLMGGIQALVGLKSDVDLTRILLEELGDLRITPPGVRCQSIEESLRLCIEVRENQRMVVDLTFPAATIHHLEDLIPDEVNTRLCKQGIDLPEIKNRALSKGLVPQVLFETTSGERTYLVRIV